MSAQAAPGRLLSRLWTTGAADAPAQAASPAKAERTLRFCSFNVLADGLAQHGTSICLANDPPVRRAADPTLVFFPGAGEWANAAAPDLEWDQRWPQLQQEVLRADADVVGLAECNNFSSHWRTFFEQQVCRSPRPVSRCIIPARQGGCYRRRMAWLRTCISASVLLRHSLFVFCFHFFTSPLLLSFFLPSLFRRVLSCPHLNASMFILANDCDPSPRAVHKGRRSGHAHP